MSDDQVNESTADDAQPGTQPVEQPPPRMFSLDEVNRIVADRLARTKADKQQEQRAEPKVSKKEIKSDVEQLREELARDRARVAFERVALKSGVADEAVDDLFALYDVQKPSDPKQWLEEKTKLLGIKSTATPTATPVAQVPAVPPAVAERAPSKVDPITSNGLVNVFSMTPGQIDQMGHVQFREHFEKILEYAKSQSGAPPKPRVTPRK